MKQLQVGSVVRATAGRDKDKLFAVVSTENEYVFIADGKTRKLTAPKRKNPKHIWPVGQIVLTDSVSNKGLRKALAKFEDAELQGGREKFACQKKM